MKRSRSMLSHIITWLIHQKQGPDIRLRISNLTRRTILASSAELADSGQKRRKGLLGRNTLAPGEGLWILPCEAVHTFGMRFPIDLIYLDRNHHIKKVRSNVRPWRLSACFTAHSVIELASGTIRQTQTQPGDRIEFASTPFAEEASSAFSAHALGVAD